MWRGVLFADGYGYWLTRRSVGTNRRRSKQIARPRDFSRDPVARGSLLRGDRSDHSGRPPVPMKREDMRLERGTHGVLAAAIALVCTAIPAAAIAKTKTCGQTRSCSISLSSTPPPETSPGAPGRGGGAIGGGGGGSGTPSPVSAPAPAPAPRVFSTFNVMAKARSSRRIQSGSTMMGARDAGRRLVCPGYTRRDKSWFEFVLTTRTRMGITYEITDAIHDTTREGIRFCAGLGYKFTTYSGRPARHATLPDGTRGYVGLLPLCKEDATGRVLSTGPCITFIVEAKDSNSSTGVDTILGVQIPATTQSDPWGGG
jgi:hypothetical protein